MVRNRRCPPSTFCISPSIFIGVFLIIGLLFFLFLSYNYNQQPIIIEKTIHKPQQPVIQRQQPFYDAYQPPYNLLNRQRTPTAYEQIGFLTHNNTILPLFGRRLHSGRDKWNYYTLTDKFVSVKVPVIKNGKNGMDEYGCDEIIDGETVYVHGYNELFKATIYQTQTPIYIP